LVFGSWFGREFAFKFDLGFGLELGLLGLECRAISRQPFHMAIEARRTDLADRPASASLFSRYATT
jgi:hypothetical protein